MSIAAKGQELIGRLYQLIADYEIDPTSLTCEDFADLYQRVVRAIELGGESETAAFSLDQALFNAVTLESIDTSDLRCVVSHALAIHHRYHADYGRGFEQAYRWCEQSRVQHLPDLNYLHTYLLPKIFHVEAMGGNLAVQLFLLEQIGRFENTQESPVWEDEKAGDLLNQEPGEIIYQLVRRRVKYQAEKLTEVPGSLEQVLHKDKAFEQLCREHQEKTPLLIYQIEVYGYSQKEGVWTKLGRALRSAFRGIVERMAGEYLAYELTKRKGAYLVQVLLMLLIVMGLAMAMFGWAYQSNQRWRSIEGDIDYVNSEIKGRIDNSTTLLKEAKNELARIQTCPGED